MATHTVTHTTHDNDVDEFNLDESSQNVQTEEREESEEGRKSEEGNMREHDSEQEETDGEERVHESDDEDEDDNYEESIKPHKVRNKAQLNTEVRVR